MRSAVSRPPAPAWLVELRACLALSWPLVLTNAIEMALNLTSIAMIGRIGPEALAAATLGQALNNVFLLFGIGVTAAVAPLLAREIGRGGDAAPAVRRVVQHGFWGALLIAGPIWLVMWNAEPIFIALGQEPGLAAAAAAYLHVLQWSILPALLYLVLRSLLSALERPRWAVTVGVAAIGLNVLLNWLFIGGHAGFPALGLSGSGLATLLSNLFMAGALGLIVVLNPSFRRFRVFEGVLRPNWSGFGDFWRLGLPIGVNLMLETGMFAAAAALVGRFDAASLAAHAIALQVAAFTFMLPLGLAQAATIRIGRASGAGDGAGIIRAGWTALRVALVVMTLSATILATMPHPIIAAFLDTSKPGSADVDAIAATLLGLAGLFQIADGSQVVLGGMLRGLRDTRVPMLLAAVGYWGVGLPVGAFLAFGLGMRAPGVWLGLSAGLFTVAGLLLVRWRRLVAQTVLPLLEPKRHGSRSSERHPASA